MGTMEGCDKENVRMKTNNIVLTNRRLRNFFRKFYDHICEALEKKNGKGKDSENRQE